MPVDRGDGKAIPGGSRREPGLGLYYFLNHVCYSSRAHCYHVCYHICKARTYINVRRRWVNLFPPWETLLGRRVGAAIQEREADDVTRMRDASDVDLERGPRIRGRAVDGRERDADFQGWRERAARHHADLAPAGQGRLSVTRDRLVVHANPDEASVVATCALREKRGPAEELAIPLDDPLTMNLERCLSAVEILPREEVALLQA